LQADPGQPRHRLAGPGLVLGDHHDRPIGRHEDARPGSELATEADVEGSGQGAGAGGRGPPHVERDRPAGGPPPPPPPREAGAPGRPPATSGRPTSPMKSVSPVRTILGWRETAVSTTRTETLSGVWPGVSRNRNTTWPRRISSPSRTARWGKAAPARA